MSRYLTNNEIRYLLMLPKNKKFRVLDIAIEKGCDYEQLRQCLDKFHFAEMVDGERHGRNLWYKLTDKGKKHQEFYEKA